MATFELTERRLLLAAELRAAQAGLGIAPDCAALLGQFIHDGALALSAQHFLKDEARVALAESNIVAFTARMIVEARALGMTELHEPTFFGARMALCPIWPFC